MEDEDNDDDDDDEDGTNNDEIANDKIFKIKCHLLLLKAAHSTTLQQHYNNTQQHYNNTQQRYNNTQHHTAAKDLPMNSSPSTELCRRGTEMAGNSGVAINIIDLSWHHKSLSQLLHILT